MWIIVEKRSCINIGMIWKYRHSNISFSTFIFRLPIEKTYKLFRQIWYICLGQKEGSRASSTAGTVTRWFSCNRSGQCNILLFIYLFICWTCCATGSFTLYIKRSVVVRQLSNWQICMVKRLQIVQVVCSIVNTLPEFILWA